MAIHAAGHAAELAQAVARRLAVAVPAHQISVTRMRRGMASEASPWVASPAQRRVLELVAYHPAGSSTSASASPIGSTAEQMPPPSKGAAQHAVEQARRSDTTRARGSGRSAIAQQPHQPGPVAHGQVSSPG